MTIEVVALIILILLSGFFSGVETALMSVSNVKVRQLYEKKKKGSRFLKTIKDDPHRLIVTLLLGNNLVNIAASALATAIAISEFGNYGVGIATGGMTFLILIFGEICPKSIAVNNSETISLRVAPFIYMLKKLLFPFVLVLDNITKLLTNLFSTNKGEEPLVTEEELRDIVTIGEKEGSINQHEKNMIDNIFELNDTHVGEIMTPRTDMFALNGNSTVMSVIDDYLKQGFTRVPIFEKTRDNVTGIIHVAQIFDIMTKKKGSKKLRTIKNPVMYVPETKKVDSLLREFQKRKEHLAIVIDEFGGVSGLITIEDLIEEIVGEIYDETDKAEYPIVKRSEKEFILAGDVNLDDLEKETGVKIECSENVNTIGGCILDQLGKIPRRGERVEMSGIELKVEKISKHRIKTVKMTKG